MNELKYRLAEISDLNWASPGAAARLSILTDHVRTLMRSYAFLSGRTELLDLIRSTPMAEKASDAQQFMYMQNKVVYNVKQFFAAFRQQQAA